MSADHDRAEDHTTTAPPCPGIVGNGMGHLFGCGANGRPCCAEPDTTTATPPDGGALAPYADVLAVLDSLPVIVREARRRRGASVRAAAQEIGVSFSTVSRIESGADCHLSHAVAALRWASTH